jgi:hypothetical protein
MPPLLATLNPIMNRWIDQLAARISSTTISTPISESDQASVVAQLVVVLENTQLELSRRNLSWLAGIGNGLGHAIVRFAAEIISHWQSLAQIEWQGKPIYYYVRSPFVRESSCKEHRLMLYSRQKLH